MSLKALANLSSRPFAELVFFFPAFIFLAERSLNDTINLLARNRELESKVGQVNWKCLLAVVL